MSGHAYLSLTTFSLFALCSSLSAFGQDASQPPAPVPAVISKLAFQVPRDAASGIGIEKILPLGEVYVLDSYNSKPRHLVLGEFPAISPDGARIAYCERAGDGRGYGQMYVINADGSGRKQITNVKHAGECFPQWSPDGLRIVFVEFGDHTSTIRVMDSDGQNPKSITSGSHPKWSPDGKGILFTRSDGGTNVSIWVVNADGTEVHKITEVNYPPVNPSWFPDGQAIAFEQKLNDRTAIYEVNVDGTNLHLLQSNVQVSLCAPILSPNGKFLVAEAQATRSLPMVVLIEVSTHRAWPLARGTNANLLWNK